MIKYFSLIIIIICLTTPDQSWAKGSRLLHVELSYSGMAASYNLYKNGELVCSGASTKKSQIDCSIEIDPTPMTFVLTAVDEDGIESPQSTPYILAPPKQPAARFTSVANSKAAPAIVSYDASKSDDLDGMIIHYIWSFGDGSEGSGQFIDHTYSTPGTYTTQLTVTDDDKYSTTLTSQITIDPAPSSFIYKGIVTPPAPSSTPIPTSGNNKVKEPTPDRVDSEDTLHKNQNSLWSHLLSRIITFLTNYLFVLNY